MFLLDTNVVSQRTKPQPHPAVVAWLQAIPSQETYLSVITLQEVWYGAEKKRQSAEQRRIEAWIRNDLMIRFAPRILPVDAAVAEACGRLAAQLQRKRYTPSPSDALIASTALVHDLAVATLNRKHFEPLGVKLVKF